VVLNLTEHSLLFTCYECTIEQGPSHSTLGHYYFGYGNYSAEKPRFLSTVLIRLM
jgi:hypothetical protein